MGREDYAWLYKTKGWKTLRARQLKLEPYCRFHALKGKEVLATHVDHTKAHKGDRRLFFDERNLQSLCDFCHNAVKQSHEKRPRQAIGLDGFPIGEKR